MTSTRAERPRCAERCARSRGHRRQVEQHQLELGRARRDRAREGAFAAADIEQAPCRSKRIGVQHVLGDKRLRLRHQAL